MRQYFLDSNYFELLMVLSSFAKISILKLKILFFQYLWCQNQDQWHKLSGKNTQIFLNYFWLKNKRV